MAARRPPLNRGHSMPTYPGSQSTSYGTGVETTASSLAFLNISDSRSGTLGTRAGELMKRGDGSRPSLYESIPDARAQYPTPPHPASAMGRGQHYQQTYFPIQSPPNLSRTRSQPSTADGMAPYTPPINLPVITSPVPNRSSTLLRGRANSQQHSNVAMTIETAPHQYTLMAPLGHGFSADSITITARRENVISIVADRWDQEQDCHHEWQVQFGRDSDMSSVHANFDNGLLKITVRRLHTIA